MYRTDILIVGAGVIGLAIAERLGRLNKNIVVVEKNGSFGQETSSRNSEVIHAGIYYPPGSLKAKLCVRGRELLYDFCAANNIPHKKTGKLIIASERDEISVIESLFTNGCRNGASGLRVIGPEEMKSLEPEAAGFAALYSPETGIMDTHAFMKRLYDGAREKGATIALGSEVSAITGGRKGYVVTVRDAEGDTELSTDVLINCAGLDSDTIAEMAGMDIKTLKYELRYCKGQYFRVNQRKAPYIKRLIYPMPHPKAGGLGIHATPDLGGGLRLGPDHEYMKNRVKDYSVDGLRAREFCASAKRIIPFIEEDDIYPDTSGIRPKLHDYGNDFRDFVISEETMNGFPGLINLIGIESPGFTASLAIADTVEDMVL